MDERSRTLALALMAARGTLEAAATIAYDGHWYSDPQGRAQDAFH